SSCDPNAALSPDPAHPETHSLSYTTLFRSGNGVAPQKGFTRIQSPAEPIRHRVTTRNTGPDLNNMEKETQEQIINIIREKFEEEDRKSTRLNSSHVKISYAVFCLKKKNAHG